MQPAMHPEHAVEFLRARRGVQYGRLGAALVAHFRALDDRERAHAAEVRHLHARIAHLDAELARVRAETAAKLARKDAALIERRDGLLRILAELREPVPLRPQPPAVRVVT